MIKNYKIIFRLVLILLCTGNLKGYTQQPDENYEWWNEVHGWEEGDPGWRNWIKITPGYLGPNALPVPHVHKGTLKTQVEFEITASNHFHPGDYTHDVSGYLYYPFAKNKIAVELYGVILEQFAFSEEIRNERYARIKDGRGLAFGDFYFSTLIQLVHNRRFPNTLLRLAAK